MIDLYCDGGLIGSNPSKIGGTWAWVQVEDGQEVGHDCGHLTPVSIALNAVTNNFTELYAVCRGLRRMPTGWNGVIYTDSNVTRLRVRLNGKGKPAMRGIPLWLQARLIAEQSRLGKYKVSLLAGHPTKQELADGFRERIGNPVWGRPEGNVPVSKHNVRCDELCKEAGRKYLASLESALNSV